MQHNQLYDINTASFIEGQLKKTIFSSARENQLYFYKLLTELNLITCLTSKPNQVSQLHALITLGYGCRSHGLLLSMGAQFFAAHTALNQVVRNRYQEAVFEEISAGNKIIGFAATEAEAGSDVMAMQSTYTRTGEDFLLQGQKSYITNATTADYFLIFCTKNPKLYDRGLSLFLVRRDTPGLEIKALDTSNTLQDAGLGNMTLHNVRINQSTLVGKECCAASIFHAALKVERALILIPHIGTMIRWFTICLQRSKARHQFKKPLHQFQHISDRLVEMNEVITLSYLLAKHIYDEQQIETLFASLIKNHISRSMLICHQHLISIFGAAGIVNPYITENIQDTYASAIYSGTYELQKNIMLNCLLDNSHA